MSLNSLFKGLIPIWPKAILLAALFFITSNLTGCATYQSEVFEARNLLESGQFEKAVEILKEKSQKPGGDQLVYLLDYATALQIAGRIDESTKEFLKAEKLIEESDYHSLSRVAGSMLLNEEMKQYKGDTFEKIFINAQLAINFLEQGQFDSALVETRRINEKFQKYRQEDKQPFELNVFAIYLSALIWEATKKYDDAIIAYTDAYALDPNIEGIEEDLVRASKLARRNEEYKKWKTKFPHVVEQSWWYDKNYSHVVVIHQQGWGPRKNFDPYDRTWPVLNRVYNQTSDSEVYVNNQVIKSKFIYNVETAAKKSLLDDRAALIARRVAAQITKDVVSERIRKENELLGVVAWVALTASDRADLRQWSTLPSSIQIIRIPLKGKDKYEFMVQGVDSSGVLTPDQVSYKDFEVKPGRYRFINWRTLR